MNYRQYRKPERGEYFLIGCDTSAGLGDYCTAQFLSRTKLDIPIVFHDKVLLNDMTNALLPFLEKLYDQTGVRSTIAYERNNGGVFEFERLAGLNRGNKFELYKMRNTGSIENPDPTKLGWDTNTATRPRMLSDLKDAVDKKLITIYDKPTINEMYSFIIARTTSTEKAQAERGAHDDLVMALAIAWQLYQILPNRTLPNNEPLPVFTPSDNVIGI